MKNNTNSITPDSGGCLLGSWKRSEMAFFTENCVRSAMANSHNKDIVFKSAAVAMIGCLIDSEMKEVGIENSIEIENEDLGQWEIVLRCKNLPNKVK